MSDQKPPREIFLQVEDGLEFWDTSWSQDRINDADIRYTLAATADQGTQQPIGDASVSGGDNPEGYQPPVSDALPTADAPPEEVEEYQVPDLGESTVHGRPYVAGGRRYQLGIRPGSADIHVRKGYMILRCEVEYVSENKDGAITFGLNNDDIARLLEVLARSGNLPAALATAQEDRK